MKVVFEQQMKTHDGWVCGVDVLPQSIEYANPNVDPIMMGEADMRQRNESCKKTGKSAELYQEKSSLIRKGQQEISMSITKHQAIHQRLSLRQQHIQKVFC